MRYVWIAVIVLSSLLGLHLIIRLCVFAVYKIIKRRYDKIIGAYQRQLQLELLIDTPKGTSISQINQQSAVTQISEITPH